MRKRFACMIGILDIFLMFLCSNVNAQIYNGDLFLTTQSQVDAFNYTEVTGNLRVISSFFPPDGIIQNIDGLSELTKVGGDFYLGGTRMSNLQALLNLQSVGKSFFVLENLISNLNGLSNLTSVGDHLSLTGNFRLTDLSGLSNLNVLGGGLGIERNPLLTNVDVFSTLPFTTLKSLTINDNPLLTDLTGFSNLTSITGPLGVMKSPSLTNLSGLSGITTVGNLSIVSNENLIHLDELSGITTVGGDVQINLNDNLENLDGLSGILAIDEGLMIFRNKALTNLDGLANLSDLGGSLILNPNPNLRLAISIRENASLTDFCGLYNLFHSGEIINNQALPGNIQILDNGANTVALATQPITVNADQGLCSAKLSEAIIGNATILGCLEPFSTVTHSDFPPGFVFSVGVHQITWTVTDGANNTGSAIQTITVVDNQPPTINCPANITVKCASDIPTVDINSVTVTDNCLAVISHAGDVISHQTCANRFVLTRTYKVTDAGNNTATCSQVITVNDDILPQIAGFTVSKQALWPPDHTMRDIILNYTVSDNCVSTPIVTVAVSSNEPINGTADGDTDPDWEIIDDHHVKLRAERAANGDGRTYTVTVTVDDGCNSPVSQSKQVMVAHNITGPQSGKPFKVGSIVNFSGVYQDKAGNTHTAKWLLDGNVAANGTVTEPSGNVHGKVSGSYKFNTPGVYKLQMNITDQTGITSYANTNNDLDAIVVIYDPNGGNTYGGGYFNSPAGALRSNPSATGKASYGFAMNYFKNSTNPKGETQFEFKVGEFEFNALNFDYLVISNSMAQFKGTGKIIGGQSGVGFTMTVVDGQLDGTGIDKLRMKIYNKNNGTIIYDNQAGASDAALPTQAVGANSTIVISGANSSLTRSNTTTQNTTIEASPQKSAQAFDVIAFPNPSTNSFSITVHSKANEKMFMQVVDMYGRIIEKRNINATSILGFGEKYRPGTYYISIMQGKEHRQLKLVKLSE